MKIPEGLKCEITPEDAYPGGVPDIPQYCDFVRFGNPKPGELFLANDGKVLGASAYPGVVGAPRIIVREKPRRWVVEFYGDLAYADHDQNGSPCGRQVNIIREVKPITRQRLREVCAFNSPIGLLEGILRELGIEVED